MGESLSL